jgi:hypothetical protein
LPSRPCGGMFAGCQDGAGRCYIQVRASEMPTQALARTGGAVDVMLFSSVRLPLMLKPPLPRSEKL